jgi:2,4-dienoyl-CoA reductase-like NADH-dependent reductase (Old Yellow Enzyme family)
VSKLFSPLKLRDVTLRNRIVVSPMCMYSATDGVPDDWHLVHLGSRAVGGAGLVLTEATAVTPEGRISPADTGLWNDAQQSAWARIAAFVKSQGAPVGVQLAHAGRKASTAAPWLGGKPVPLDQGGWQPVAPSPVPFDKDHPVPHMLTHIEIAGVTKAFATAARRAVAAGFDLIELHMAHGYLLHEFLSPLSNPRSDEYGGTLDNRMRLPVEVARAVRTAIPAGVPLLVRISATDWADGGWDIGQSVELAKRLKESGVDLIDCSTGGLVPHVKIPAQAGYQVPFAEGVRRQADIPTGAVGLITDPRQAEEILTENRADVVLIARELLRDPYWPLHAARQLGDDVPWPKQYERAKPR